MIFPTRTRIFIHDTPESRILTQLDYISLRHFGRLAKRWQHWARDISPRRVPLNLSTFPSLYLLSLFLCGIHFPFQSCNIFVLPLSRHQHGRT